jgi:hypothetical protein
MLHTPEHDFFGIEPFMQLIEVRGTVPAPTVFGFMTLTVALDESMPSAKGTLLIFRENL